MSKDKIRVYRYRNTPYTVNFPMSTGIQTYRFAGSKKNKYDSKMLPSEVVNWLQLSTTCFKNGELVLDKKSIASNEEVYVESEELEEYEKNTHTREEVIEILEGNFMKMKSVLNKISSDSEKRFFINIAKEIKIDSTAKRDLLAEWVGTNKDILFASIDDKTDTAKDE